MSLSVTALGKAPSTLRKRMDTTLPLLHAVLILLTRVWTASVVIRPGLRVLYTPHTIRADPSKFGCIPLGIHPNLLRSARIVWGSVKYSLVLLITSVWSTSAPFLSIQCWDVTALKGGWMLGDVLCPPMFPPIFLRHLCIFLLIIASPRRSALAAPIPESDDHVT